jgi:hypothetical protein
VNVAMLAPSPATVDVAELCERLRAPESLLEPFGPATLAFCDAFSRALFRNPAARRFPELQALAFWMRRTELLRMKQQFDALATPDTVLLPRGLVFHIPPSNVDTIFVYSWILSVLAGNANVIRFSERAGEAATTLCQVLVETMAAEGAALSNGLAILRYGRNNEITAALSAACDVRVIWGGDGTVNSVREFRLQPHAKELTFPDRYSMVMLKASAYQALDDHARRELASRAYNDVFWFDQMACSSPQTAIWVGEREACDEAAADFARQLQVEVAGRGYEMAAGAKISKLTNSYRAVIDQPAIEQHLRLGPELIVLKLSDLHALQREHGSGGMLYQAWTPELADIGRILIRRDQTITHFGFSAEELREFAIGTRGRGGDRFVPVGQALSFHRYWDGYDLLREFTRTVFFQE